MANSTKAAGSFLVPLGVVSVIVVAALAATFFFAGEEPPDQATIGDPQMEVRPAGAGTIPEGQADELVEGISDELDNVDPAAPDVDTIPPAPLATEGGATDNDIVAGPQDAQPGLSNPNDAAGATVSAEDVRDMGLEADTPAAPPAPSTATETQEIEIDRVIVPSADDAPAGRDAEVVLTPEEGQDIVTDPDGGGTPFIPTPSGPEGRDDQTILE